MSNPDHRHTLEDALTHTRYTPGESFAAELHTRLRQQMGASAVDEKAFDSAPGTRHAGLQLEEWTVSNRFRWIAVFSLGLLALMVFLFVRLVLIRPSGFAVPGTPDEPTTRVDALFGDEITLTGYNVSETGRTWDITLYWVPEAQPAVDYHISITGMSGDQVIAQQDEPLLGTDLTSSVSTDHDLPTTRWQPRRFITSHHTLTIPDGGPLPPAVFVGL